MVCRWLGFFVFAGVIAGLVGCGSSLPDGVAPVSGRVTLSGQPLTGALVTFLPVQQGGSTSLARTDDDGRYTLSYGGSIAGAEIGKHRVTITTFSRGNPDGDPPRAATAEKVPAQYNRDSTLTCDVIAGENSIDFDLQPSGQIVAAPIETAE